MTAASAVVRAAPPDLPSIPPDGRLRRIVDIAVASIGLVLAAPVLAALAVAVRLTSRGPAIFRQQRVGRDGQEFDILKFRTMRAATGTVALVSGPNDPRVTRLGARLRRIRLDELPQLVNLARGDLTLVGPRPEVPRFVAHYTERERQLLTIRPGIIGAGALLFASSQASRLDEVADPDRCYVELLLHPRLDADLEYALHRCVRGDVALIRRAIAYCAGAAS